MTPPHQTSSGKRLGSLAGLLSLALLSGACAKEAAAPGEVPGGEFGTVVLALTSIPGDVQCVRLTVTGNSTVVRTFPVTPNDPGPSTVTMAGLPLGSATVYEDTFNSACDAVGPMSIPTWVAQAPVPVTLSPGVQTSVTIVLRRPGGLQLGMDYQESTGGLSVMPAVADFGNVPVGQASPPRLFVVANNSAAAALLSVSLGGPGFSQYAITSNTCATSVPAGGTCGFQLQFSPSTTGPKPATVTIASPVSSVVATLTGTGVESGLSMSPTTADFGEVAVRNTASPSLTFLVTNHTASPAAVVTSISGDPISFVVASACDSPIAAGGTCSVSVRFVPFLVGQKSATVVVSSPTAGSASAALTGTGIPTEALEIQPLAGNFGNVTVGGPGADLSFSVHNLEDGITTGPLNIALTGSDVSQFQILGNACLGPVVPGGGCSLTVRFQPTTVGTKTATLSVSASPGGMLYVPLTGTGLGVGLLISPGSYDFNNVIQGTRKGTARFTVQNVGSAVTGPLALQLASGEFVIAPTSTTCIGAQLVAGGSCTVGVDFAPALANPPGPKSRTLVVSGAPGGSVSATVQGTSIVPSAVTLSPGTADIGYVALGSSSPPITFTVTNAGSVSTSPLETALANGVDASFTFGSDQCKGLALPPGGSCTLAVIFTPPSPGSRSVFLLVSGVLSIATLTGTGVLPNTLTLTPPSASYGDVVVGQVATQTFTVINTSGGPAASLAISLSGDSSQFQVLNNTCNGTLAINAACTFDIGFAPTSSGEKSAHVTASALGVSSAEAYLSGNGLGIGFNLSPSSLSFHEVPVGSLSQAIWTVTVTNGGGGVSGVPAVLLTGPDAGHYQLTSNTCTSALAIGASCTFQVRFAPTTLGSKTASATVSASDAPTAAATLTGTAIDWSHQDVGAIGTAPGNWSQLNGVHTVRGSGADIFTAADAFHYVYRNISGNNVTFTARVTSIENVNQWSKAVVMMRSTTDANALYVAAVVPALASNLYRQQYRTVTGGVSPSNPGGSGATGAWLRITRAGNLFSTFFSTNGTFFQPLGSPVTINMPVSFTVGMGVTSHKPNTLAAGTFDQVSITMP